MPAGDPIAAHRSPLQPLAACSWRIGSAGSGEGGLLRACGWGLGWDGAPHSARGVQHASPLPHARLCAWTRAQVTSTLDFVNTDHLDVAWQLERRGKVIAAGMLDAMPRLTPHAKWSLPLDEGPWQPHLASAYDTPLAGPLTLSLITTHCAPTAWAPAHAWLGTHSFELAPPHGSACSLATFQPIWRELPPAGLSSLSLICMASEGWAVRGAGFEVRVDAAGVASMSREVDGEIETLLARGPVPCLWRAPTDNDEFGRFADTWRDCGLDDLQRRVESVRAWQPAGGIVSIQVDWRLVGRGGQRIGVASFAYIVTSDGELELCAMMHIDMRNNNGASKPPSLPRLGVALEVPRRLQRVDWLGLGPHENYPDRKSSAAVGRWHAPSVADMHTPYVVPSENGTRGGVRWLALREPARHGKHGIDGRGGGAETDDEGAGDGAMDTAPGEEDAAAAVMPIGPGGGAAAGVPGSGGFGGGVQVAAQMEEVAGAASAVGSGAQPLGAGGGGGGGLLLAAGPLTPPLHVNVSEYSLDALSRSRHEAELEASRDVVHVHLDLHHMGVGGHDSWTALRTVGERYFVAPTQRALMRVRFAPLAPSRVPSPWTVPSDGNGAEEVQERAEEADEDVCDATALGRARPIVHSHAVVLLRALPATSAMPPAAALFTHAHADDGGNGQHGFRFAFGEAPSAEGTGGDGDGSATATDGDRAAPAAAPMVLSPPDDDEEEENPPTTPEGAASRGSVDSESFSRSTASGLASGTSAGYSNSSVANSPQRRRWSSFSAAGAVVGSPSRDAFLRIAASVGVAALPPILPATSRHFAGAILEKPGGGPIHDGNTISLRGPNGQCLEVESERAQARWSIAADWQGFGIELVGGNGAGEGGGEGGGAGGTAGAAGRVLMHGDVVCLRAHTGGLLRCPMRESVGTGEQGGVMMAPLDASASSYEQAQKWELLLC